MLALLRTAQMEGSAVVSTLTLITLVAGQLQPGGVGYQEVEREPEFLSPLENITAAQGREVHFTCSVNNLGHYKVAWIKSDTKTILAIHTQMVTLNNRLSVTHNGHNTWKLYIHNVQPRDSGTYMCQINTIPMKMETGHLIVVVPPDIADEEGGGGGAVQEGNPLELHCRATGFPLPTVTWKRDGGKAIIFRNKNGDEIQALDSFTGPILRLPALQRTDMGGYLCIASNGVPPTISKRFDIVVLFEPVVKTAVRVVSAPVEADVTLQCLIETTPKSLNTWHKRSTGFRLLNGTKYTIQEVSLSEYEIQLDLTIHYLTREDFGDYACIASNTVGQSEAYVRLQEIYLPPKTTTTTTTSTTTTTTTTPSTTTSRKPPMTQRTRKPPVIPPSSPNEIAPKLQKNKQDLQRSVLPTKKVFLSDGVKKRSNHLFIIIFMYLKMLVL